MVKCSLGDQYSVRINLFPQVEEKNQRINVLAWSFPHGSADKESNCNAGDLSVTPGLGRSPGEENSYPLQYSGLENSMDCIVHGAAKSLTLTDFHFHFHLPFHSSKVPVCVLHGLSEVSEGD